MKLPTGTATGLPARRSTVATVDPDVAIAHIQDRLTDRDVARALYRNGTISALIDEQRHHPAVAFLDPHPPSPLFGPPPPLGDILTRRVWALTKAVHSRGHSPVWFEGAARLLTTAPKPLILFVDSAVRRTNPYRGSRLDRDIHRHGLDRFSVYAALALYVDATCDDVAACCAVTRPDLLRLCWGTPAEPD